MQALFVIVVPPGLLSNNKLPGHHPASRHIVAVMQNGTPGVRVRDPLARGNQARTGGINDWRLESDEATIGDRILPIPIRQ